jgi:hypothetical protein
LQKMKATFKFSINFNTIEHSASSFKTKHKIRQLLFHLAAFDDNIIQGHRRFYWSLTVVWKNKQWEDWEEKMKDYITPFFKIYDKHEAKELETIFLSLSLFAIWKWWKQVFFYLFLWALSLIFW